MSRNTYRAPTALVASLALLLPQGPLVGPAKAQDMILLCLSGELPPCPEGEPTEGTPVSVTDPIAADAVAAINAAAAQAEAEAQVAA